MDTDQSQPSPSLPYPLPTNLSPATRFVLEQPFDMRVRDVVALARERGIAKVDEGRVYVVRRNVRLRQRQHAAVAPPPAAAVADPPALDAREELIARMRALVVRIGTDAAQDLINAVEEMQTVIMRIGTDAARELLAVAIDDVVADG